MIDSMKEKTIDWILRVWVFGLSFVFIGLIVWQHYERKNQPIVPEQWIKNPTQALTKRDDGDHSRATNFSLPTTNYFKSMVGTNALRFSTNAIYFTNAFNFTNSGWYTGSSNLFDFEARGAPLISLLQPKDDYTTVVSLGKRIFKMNWKAGVAITNIVFLEDFTGTIQVGERFYTVDDLK